MALACIWCVSTLSGIKKKVGVDCGGGRDRKKREGRRGQGEKEKERGQEEKLNQKEKSGVVDHSFQTGLYECRQVRLN